jgi:hypothetical protein
VHVISFPGFLLLLQREARTSRFASQCCVPFSHQPACLFVLLGPSAQKIKSTIVLIHLTFHQGVLNLVCVAHNQFAAHLFRRGGASARIWYVTYPFPNSTTCIRGTSVKRFAQDVVGPKVREMDENEMMDPSVVKCLFEQGVRDSALPSAVLCSRSCSSWASKQVRIMVVQNPRSLLP